MIGPELLKDMEISAMLAANHLEMLHVTDSKKDEIIENLANFYKGGRFNPVYEQIIKKSLTASAENPGLMRSSIVKHFGEEYVNTLSHV